MSNNDRSKKSILLKIALGLILGTCIFLFRTGVFENESNPTEDEDAPISATNKNAVDTLKLPPRLVRNLHGTIKEPPDWLSKDAPFDTESLIVAPPVEKNAAPLYLKAFAEFHPILRSFVAQKDRSPIAADHDQRLSRFHRQFQKWVQNPSSFSQGQLESVVSPFRKGFQLLEDAQKKPLCLFATGIGLSVSLPHVQGSQTVFAVAEMQSCLNLKKGNIDESIKMVEKLLRISRDISRNGFRITQQICFGNESVCYGRMISQILKHRNLSQQHCDKLLKILKIHSSSYPNRLEIASKMDYFTMRDSLRIIELELKNHMEKKFEEGNLSRRKTKNNKLKKLIDNLLGPLTEEIIRKKFIPEFFVAERKLIEEFYAISSRTANDPYRERKKLILEFQRQLHNKLPPFDAEFSFVIRLFPDISISSESYTKTETKMNACLCLIALKRWQLTHNATSDDLLEIVQDAGMKEIPRDPYGKSALKLTTRGNRPVIYSVGLDGKDQKAKLFSITEDRPGDMIFFLE